MAELIPSQRQAFAPELPLTKGEDLGEQYLKSKTEEPGRSALDALLGRVEARESTPAGAPESPRQQVLQLPGPPSAPEDERSTLDRVVDAAADPAKGVVEAPRQIAGGVVDAAQQASNFLFSATEPLARFLEEQFPLGSVAFTDDGVELVEGFGGGRPELPEIDDPKSTTGGAIRSTAQFLTGFIPLFRGAKAVGAGTGVAGATAGAMTDFTVFDPHEGRLSDLWQELGLPETALTEYLAADPGDSEIEGRFKNAIEGAGIGVMAEGVFRAAHLIRAARIAKRGDEGAEEGGTADPLTNARARYGEVEDRDFLILGDPNEPLFSVESPKPEDGAAKLRDSQARVEGVTTEDLSSAAQSPASVEMIGNPQIRVNFAAIDEPDDLQQIMGDMVELFAGDIDQARRGRQSFEETEALAEQLGMTVQDLLARRKGQPFNAEEALAARQLWATSAEKLLEAARIAASPQASSVDQFNFRRMLAMHHAIQAEVVGARTETARALNAWKIPAGGSVERARALDELLEAMGGQQASAEMARRLAILEASGAPEAAISEFVRRGWGAATSDAIKEVWVNGLLFSPKTHVVNISSNTGVALQQILERGVAGQFARLRGAPDGVVPSEAAAMTYGLISGLRDAFRLSWRAVLSDQTGAALGKIDLPRKRAFSAEAFNLNEAGAAGRTVDFLGTVFRVPGRLLGAEDEFFKTIGYRMELHAQADRLAAQEGLTGADFDRRVAEILADPPEHIRIASADAALYNTFTNQTGWFGEAMLKARGADKPLSPVPFILPFVRTPVNIARYAFERTPLAPLVGQWRADVAAGGARRDLALARMATGTTIMLLAADLADSGQVTGRGPKDQGEREALLRQGWQPYSIRVGERWVSFNRADPFGMTMGFAADITEAIKRGDIDEDDVDEAQEVVAMAIAAVSQVTINKTYMQGMAEFMDMVGNPQSYSESYVNDFIGSFVPFGGLTRAVEGAVDPTLREVNSPADAVAARIAGWSDSLQPRRDLWGEPVKAESGLGKTYDFFAPWSARAVKKSPIDAELTRLVMDVRRIRKKSSFEGVPVNFRDWPEVYDAYTRLAGNDLKHPAWNLGARDYLDAVVEGRHAMSRVYEVLSDGKDGGKAAFIRNAIEDYRQLARQAILTDPTFARFAEHVRAEQRERSRQRQPDFAGETAAAPGAVHQVGGNQAGGGALVISGGPR